MGRGGSCEVARRILGESCMDPRRIHPKQPPQLGPSWAPVGPQLDPFGNAFCDGMLVKADQGGLVKGSGV